MNSKKHHSDIRDKTPDANYLQNEIEGSDRLAAGIAEKYDKKYSVKYVYDRQSDFILEFLKQQDVDSILDLGCGMGNFLAKAQDRYTNILGVDPAPESLKIAKLIVPTADLVLGQSENLPFGDDEIDAIVMKGVVHHLKDPVVVFKELHRCLKPGGILVIFEGNQSSPYRRAVLALADLLKVHHESTLFQHRPPREMKQMLKEAELEPFHCRNISGFFAPLALTGIGGVSIWKVFNSIENQLQKRCPWLFNYYVELSAKKNINRSETTHT